MRLPPNIDLGPIVAALRPLAATHETSSGSRTGFFASDVTRALGSMAKASEALVALSVAGLLDSQPVFLVGYSEPHTLYNLADAPPPATTH